MQSPPPGVKRYRLPSERKGINHKFTIHGLDCNGNPQRYTCYLTVNTYEDGSPAELFVEFAKSGTRVACLLDAWATAVSVGLQSGIPLRTFVDKFKGWQFEPRGTTSSTDIPMCSSPLDYISRWLERKFIPDDTPS